MLASNSSRFHKPFVVLLILSFIWPAVLNAQTWFGPGTDWNTAVNWNPIVVPNSPSAVASFTGSGPTTSNISTSVQVQSISFSPFTGGYTITGSSGQTLTTTGITIASGVTGLQTFNLQLNSSGNLLFPTGNNLAITNNSTAASTTLLLGPSVTIGSPGSGGVVVSGPGVTQMSATFASSPNNVVGGITKNGPGTLLYSGGGASLTGGITLNGGTLTLDYSSNTGSKFNGGFLTLDGGVLSFTASSGTVTQSMPSGTAFNAGQTSISATGTGTLTMNANAITRVSGATADFALSAASPAFSVQTSTGNNPTGGLLGTGAAFATVNNGANWAVQSGVVIAPLAGFSTNIYASGDNTDVTANTNQSNFTTNSLRFNVSGLNLNISGTNILQSGGILVTPTGANNQISGTGTLAAVGGGELVVHQYAGGQLAISANISSSVGLTKTGPGILFLSGNNTGLTGPININRGSLTVSGGTVPVNSSNSINFNDDRTGNSLQTFTVALPSGTNGTINPPIRLSSFSASGSGTVITTGLITNSTVTLGGVISSAPGLTTPIQFSGESGDTSGFNLTNTNTFTGNIDLLHGSLGINSNASLGSVTNTLTLEVSDTQNGGLVFLNTGVNVARPVNLNTATRIISNGTDVNTISGGITGQGILVKTGTGTLVLSGTNNYGLAATNGTLVNGGTVTIPSGGSLSTPGNILIGNSGVSGQSGTMSLDGTASVAQTGSAFVQVGYFNNTTGTLNIGTSVNGASFTVGSGGMGIQGAASSVNVGNGAVTGILTSNGSVFVNGGTFTVNSGSTFNLGAGLELYVAGQVNFAGAGGYVTPSSTLYVVTGASGKINDAGTFQLINNAQANVSQGGTITASHVDVGINSGNGTLIVDGANSSVVATSASSSWGLSGNTANVTFSNGATGSFSNGLFLADSGFSSVVNLTVKSGAQFTTGNLDVTQGIGGGGGSPSSTVTVSDLGTFFTSNGVVNIGDSIAGDSGIINVQNNAFFTVNGSSTLFSTGTLNINGGTVGLGAFSYQGGTLNFNSGSLNFTADLSVGPTSGFLGSDLNLASNRVLTVRGTTTIDPFHSLTLSGGTFNTNSLVVNGTFVFNSGTIGFSGNSGLTIGSGGPLGASYSLGAGRTINVTNNTTIASDGILYLNGGTVNATLGIVNNGEIQILDTTSQLNGSLLTNAKLVDGNGRISLSLSNSVPGEVRASGPTQRLTFAGSSNSNFGKINLVNGGTVEFINALTNNSGGQIVGRGELIAASISNSGKMNFSGGFTDVYGSVTNNSGGSIIVTGGGTTTFWNPLANNSGANIQVSTNSTVAFEGMVTGSGTFSGSGTKIFDAGGGPSVIPALATVSGSTIVEVGSSLNVKVLNEKSLTVRGSVTIANKSQGGTTAVLSGLEVDSGGTLDVTNNAVVVNYSAVSPAASIRASIASAYDADNGGTWDLPGITSSNAAADQNYMTAVGYAEASDVAVDNGGTWQGQTIAGEAVLIKYTYYGDSNLDGVVTTDDYFAFVAGFNGQGSGWAYGDYNYDGVIDTTDLFIFVPVFNSNTENNPLSSLILNDGDLSASQKAALLSVVPEPASVGMLAMGAAAMGIRRRRKA